MRYQSIYKLLGVLITGLLLSGCSLLLDEGGESPLGRGDFVGPEFPEVDAAGVPAFRVVMNQSVYEGIHALMKGGGRGVAEALQRRDFYEPSLTKIFLSERVPPDLIHLALVESGFNPNARSRAGAVGMWQFMRPTARRYGLRVGMFRDERRDPTRSARAAAIHLRALYERYGDWYLALAAYNAGSGAVTRALKRSGAADFWTLAASGEIEKETRDFVPRVIAATLLAKEPERFGVPYQRKVA